MDLHPWQLYRYTMNDFILKVKARKQFLTLQQREIWEIAREVAFSNAIMQGKEIKNQHMKSEQFWQFPWDEKTGIAAITSHEERRKAIDELRQRYLAAARLSKN